MNSIDFIMGMSIFFIRKHSTLDGYRSTLGGTIHLMVAEQFLMSGAAYEQFLIGIG